MRAVFDIEANGLLDSTTIDYLAAPFQLKPTFRVWCAVIRDIDTGKSYRFVGDKEMREGFIPLMRKLTTIIGHNIIDYDLLAIKLYFGVDYEIGEVCTFEGKEVEIIDTLVLSKTLNPDRFGGHSLDEWGTRVGVAKIDWRGRAVELGLIPYNAPKGAEFAQYHPEMLEYCDRDTEVNALVYKALVAEMGDWNFSDAFCLEQQVRDIITRQSHRGFWFDSALAEENVRILDEKMEEIRKVVEPLLPPKPMGVTKLKQYLPPKIQFKKDGSISAVMEKWIAKHNGTLTETDEGFFVTFGVGDPNVWKLPMDCEVPILTHEPATVKDTTHIKGWLVELGWSPTVYKERDLTCDSKKKKLTVEKFQETARRYAEQTIESPFCADRCNALNTRPSKLMEKLLTHDLKRPLKVYTNPTFTIGMDKEIDPALLALADKFPHAKLISEYLTYAHRRNSILGGGVDPDELEDDDEFAGKGFLASERIAVDGRIPTPADSCGAGTSRFKHRLVANIPRITSLFGENMRSMFGVDVEEGFIQMGYDFASLEAMIESHYCWRYDDEDKTYCKSLTMEKPNDVHCYDEETEILTEVGWRKFGDIQGLKVAQWGLDGKVEFVTPLDYVWQPYTGKMVKVESNSLNMLVTPNHRQPVFKRKPGDWQTETAEKLLTCSQWGLPAAGVLDGDKEADLLFLALCVAAQADGHFTSDSSAITFTFTKERKVARLLSVLSALGAQHVVSEQCRKGRVETTVRLNAGPLAVAVRAELGGKVKTLPYSWMQLSVEAKRFVLSELKLWDGDSSKSQLIVDQKNEENIDVICGIAVTAGLKAYKSKFWRETEYSEGWVWRAVVSNANPYKSVRRTDVSEVQYEGMIGCVVVPSSYVIVRREGKIVVSGNTKTAKLIETMVSEAIGKAFPFSRTAAKPVKYACAYGAQPARVAKTVGCSLEIGELIHKAYWEAAKPLALLGEKLKQYWTTKGEKKFILGLDGRKIPTRSASALINSLFQSAGVICAKRAMVLHERKLKDAGLSVDFFREDWKNKKFVQQLVAYHDEAQLEMHKSLVKWKLFQTEEEAKAFKAENPGWSEVGHSAKGYYVGWCEAGKLIQEAVVETSRYYKLNVTLSADYILGRNWAECH